MKRLSLALILGSLLAAPASATYVSNDPINNIDPTGECTQDADGNKVGVCPTDIVSGVVLEATKFLSPETAEADALAESQGVNVPFTVDLGRTGSVTSSIPGSDGSTIAQSVIVGGQSDPVAAVDTETGRTIAYSLGPLESTAHEVGGHVRDNLTGPRQTGLRDPLTPNFEVNPIAVENNLRSALGIPVRRDNYTGRPPVTVTPNGVAPPKTAADFLRR